ncbi:hypothetical protein N7470_006535 [Penicillium chermesinum]|nr:hypothetical protein N7470_006535 [Penicillium chermesinum]
MPRLYRPGSVKTHRSPFVVKVAGPHSEQDPDHEKNLQKQLENVPCDAKCLYVDENTPSDLEWAVLGAHFQSVEDLQLESGFDENLNDKNIPLHWPLKRLEFSSACAELVQSPFIRHGLVPHLRLYLTCGLRFDGPTSMELRAKHREAIEKGEKERQFLSPESKIEFTFLPDLVAEDMQQRYGNPDRKLDPENELPSQSINMHTLEIIENDAMETFCRMALGIPRVLENLHTLLIHSTRGLDFPCLGEEMFLEALPQLDNLKTLDFSIGDVFFNPSSLPSLYKNLPPNLESLTFRGPASLTMSDQWADWVGAFGSRDFLPSLKDLVFVLDLHSEKE